MATFETTPIKDIKPAYETVRKTFLSGKTRPVAYRKQQLLQLGFLLQENEDAIVEALHKDLNKPRFESITGELLPLKGEIKEALSHVERWAAPVKVGTTFPWQFAKARIYKEPKGVALIIGTWNFPLALVLGPLVGAIAAGCSAIIKPAEQNPTVAALLGRLFPLYLDPLAYSVVNGAVDETTELLKLRFDHLFYTGSGGIGRIIAKAAAEHLTPVTLELGGKSPAVVFDDADLDVVAKRMLWGKISNAGQICIAPDYVMCTPKLQAPLISALGRAYTSLAPTSTLANDAEFTKIVSPRHFDRLSKLLDETSGTVALGGGKDVTQGKMEVTVVKDVPVDDILMKDEIFGPILPIVTMASKEEMVDYIKAHDNPLALYAFTKSTDNRDYLFNNTRSGTFVQNDVLVQFMIPGLPFGGAGQSGYGNYHGKKSFDTFTHERASASVPSWMELLLKNRYPPYTDAKLKLLVMTAGAVIKKPSKFGFANVLKLIVVLAGLTLGYRRFWGSKL